MEEIKKVMELVMSPTDDSSNLWVAYYLSKQIEGFDKMNFEEVLFDMYKGEKTKLVCPVDWDTFHAAEGDLLKAIQNSSLEAELAQRGIYTFISHEGKFCLYGDNTITMAITPIMYNGGMYLSYNLKNKETKVLWDRNSSIADINFKTYGELLLKLHQMDEEKFFENFFNSLEYFIELEGFMKFIHKIYGIYFNVVTKNLKFYKFQQLCKTGAFSLGDKDKDVWGRRKNEVVYFEMTGFEKGKIVYRCMKRVGYKMKMVEKKATLANAFGIAYDLIE